MKRFDGFQYVKDDQALKLHIRRNFKDAVRSSKMDRFMLLLEKERNVYIILGGMGTIPNHPTRLEVLEKIKAGQKSQIEADVDENTPGI